MTGKDKNVITFFTECKRSTGSGHLSRCFSLRDAFEEKGFRSRFIIDSDFSCPAEKEILDLIRLDWKTEIKAVRKLITRDSIIIIDSYLANLQQLESLSRIALYPVFISDVRMNYYPRGIVIIGNSFAEKLSLNGIDECKIIKGREFIMLRKEFWDVPGKVIQPGINSILITLGGFDQENLTNFIASEIHNFDKNLEITCLTKNACEFTSKKVRHINRNLSASEIASEILRHDIVISNGGQTLNETIRTGTPSIAVEMADNQKQNILSWTEKGVTLMAGEKNNRTKLITNILEGLDLLKSFEKRNRISLLSREFIDGQGARRACENILNHYNLNP